MPETTRYTVDEGGERLDSYVSTLTGGTRSNAKIAIERGDVLLNGSIPKKSGITLKRGDIIDITQSPPREMSINPEDIDFDIVYEDEYLAVINKPQGIVVHPCESTPDGTLVNGLVKRLTSLSGINGVMRPGIVHRLDKDTGGLLVVAKNDIAHLSLQEQIKDKTAIRKYVALVDGKMPKEYGEIIANIDRMKKNRKLMTVVKEGGRYAETHYKVVAEYGAYSLVAYELKTGRTHQIRVHSKFLGHPIVGDEPYGGSTKLYNKGQLLFAYCLSFNHPINGEKLTFTVNLPEYFYDILQKLDKNLQYTIDKLLD